jgi:hypothetical protein
VATRSIQRRQEQLDQLIGNYFADRLISSNNHQQAGPGNNLTAKEAYDLAMRNPTFEALSNGDANAAGFSNDISRMEFELVKELCYFSGGDLQKTLEAARLTHLYNLAKKEGGKSKWERSIPKYTFSKAFEACAGGFYADPREEFDSITSFERIEQKHNFELSKLIVPIQQFKAQTFKFKHPIIDPWLSEQSMAMIAADRGTGKTWFAASAANAIVTGDSFGPWNIVKPVPVLYLDGEMVPQDIQERFTSLENEQKYKAPLYIYSDALAHDLGLPSANLMNKHWRLAMKEILLEKQIKVFFLDNISSLCPGIAENESQEWGPINRWLLDLRFAGISSVLLHHTNKQGGQRGTHAREDNIDVSMMLLKPNNYSAEDGARFIAHFTKHRIKHCDLPKIADTEFRLTFNEDGKANWGFKDATRELKEEILALVRKGLSNKTIGSELSCTPQYVGKIKKQFQTEFQTNE